ncbi:MAG TPA: HAD family hydrolase [Candidatus Saccharimonadales bacterium]|nr:HAD family hydrolase [Candidatus Saccharimonadales bacterium]
MGELLSISEEQRDALGDIELVVFDIDNTLVFANDPAFYDQYGQAVERAVASHYQVSPEVAAHITDTYRSDFGGGEQALFRDDVHLRYPNVTARGANSALLFEELCRIEPTGHFAKQEAMREGVIGLRSLGLKTVALTSSPEPLSRKILAEAGFDPDEDFDAYLTYGPDELPPKMDPTRSIFAEVAQEFGAEHNHVLAVGDSLRHDITPAQQLGMLVCLIGQQRPEDYEGMLASSTIDLISNLQVSLLAKRQGLPIAGDEVRWRSQ